MSRIRESSEFVRRCDGAVRVDCSVLAGWLARESCAMTIYPKRTKCRFGGFGAGRAQGCVACTAKAKTHRKFKDKDEFIQGMRGVLLKQKFGKDDDERKLTAAEVDRVLREKAIPVEPDARLTCSVCETRIRAACLELAGRLVDGDDTLVEEPAAAAAEVAPLRMQTRRQCDLLRLLEPHLLHILSRGRWRQRSTWTRLRRPPSIVGARSATRWRSTTAP